MKLYKELKSLGLSKTESKIYIFLLTNGISTPTQIAKGTSVMRTNTYNVLNSLKDKGLIKAQKKGKRDIYVANDPQAIIRSIETKKEAAERIVPDLEALYTIQKNKPVITFYEAFSEVQDIYLQTLHADEVLAIGSTKALSAVAEDFLQSYFKKLKERKIYFQDILTEDSEFVAQASKQTMGVLYDYRFLPNNIKDQPTDILIWNDKIALITLEEPIFGTVIQSLPLAKTFKILFRLLYQMNDEKL